MLERETFRLRGCAISLSRIVGPEATELNLLCQPPRTDSRLGAARQSELVYEALLEALTARGGELASIVSETLFVRDVEGELPDVLASRLRAMTEQEPASPNRSVTIASPLVIGQPPLAADTALEVAIQALVPSSGADDLVRELVPVSVSVPAPAPPANPVDGCEPAWGLRARISGTDETRLYAQGLLGEGEDAYAQTQSMFEAAEALLERAGMSFEDVVRTWIHLRDIDRDYDALNRSRRAFFESRSVDPVPASTGIGGSPASTKHDLCLSFLALQGASESERVPRSVMTSPTLNEAGSYGADFVRGMRVEELNKVALYISGTASINERGETAHVDDFEGQAGRMILNVRALLKEQDAAFGDVVSAVTYVKNPADAPALRRKFEEAGYAGFPNAFVHAPVCRPDLLCETEALAVIGKTSGPS